MPGRSYEIKVRFAATKLIHNVKIITWGDILLVIMDGWSSVVLATIPSLYAERLTYGSLQPVSYTHLDVYKRQTILCGPQYSDWTIQTSCRTWTSASHTEGKNFKLTTRPQFPKTSDYSCEFDGNTIVIMLIMITKHNSVVTVKNRFTMPVTYQFWIFKVAMSSGFHTVAVRVKGGSQL